MSTRSAGVARKPKKSWQATAIQSIIIMVCLKYILSLLFCLVRLMCGHQHVVDPCLCHLLAAAVLLLQSPTTTFLVTF